MRLATISNDRLRAQERNIDNLERYSTENDDPGPPVLLKRLGNAVEANLAKNKLATAGIPSFLGGENTFAGDVMHPLPYREVELFVPASMVRDALEILESPPDDLAEVASEPFLDDPARVFSSRAFVCAIVGWLLFFLAVFGVVIALPAFAYAIVLSFNSLTVSTDRSISTRAKATLAVLISVAGIGTAIALLFVSFR